MTTPRGIRNNNPGNIRSGNAWKGLHGSRDGFDWFVDAAHGIRAAAKLLQTYQTAHDLNTVEKIIGRWAPPEENDTGAYIMAVSIWSGFEKDEPIDLYHYDTALRILRAMFRMENGKPPEGEQDWYKPETYERGLRMAGLTPGKPLTKSRTTGGVVVGGLSATAIVFLFLREIWPEHGGLFDALEKLVAEHGEALLAILLGGSAQAAALLSRIDDKRKGRL